MPVEVTFDRDKAAEFLKCLESGQPIGTVAREDVLTLAGACFVAAFYDTATPEEQTPGRCVEIEKAVLTARGLAERVRQGRYDSVFKPVAQFTVDSKDPFFDAVFRMSSGSNAG